MANILDYHYKHSVNVIPKDNYEELVHETFNTVADVLAKSYGPLGSNSIISEGRTSSTTKDGFTIFKNLVFSNKYKTMVYEQMRATCTKLNNTVGDGTTTAILLTAELFKSYMELKDEFAKLHLLPSEFLHIWDETISLIIGELEDKSMKIDSVPSKALHDYIYNIAFVASNGNHKLSEDVAEVYEHNPAPSIRYKNSPTNSCAMVCHEGFEFPARLLDPQYCKTEDFTVELENARVLFFAVKVEPKHFGIIKEVNEICKARKEKLIVVAPSYDEVLAKTEMLNYTNQEWRQLKEFNMYPMQYFFSKLDKYQDDDFAAILGCEKIDRLKMEIIDATFKEDGADTYDLFANDEFHILGTAPRAILSLYNGLTVAGVDKTTDSYQTLLKNAENDLKTQMSTRSAETVDYSIDVIRARERIARIGMNGFCYEVGSDSRLETGLLMDTVDDVIKACASAYKYGIVPGSQLSIIKICKSNIEWISAYCGADRYQLTKLACYKMIHNALINLYARLINGPDNNGIDRIRYMNSELDTDELSVEDLLQTSLERNMMFNILTCDFSDAISTSVMTDINVLIASSELVKLLISGNQFIYRSIETDSEEEADI